MEEYRIDRTGQAPLAFRGELLAEVSGKQIDAGAVRWHELRVYRTAGDAHIVEVAYRTKWRGEVGHIGADLVELAGLGDFLRGCAATMHVHIRGFPPLAEYATRQANLVRHLRERFEALVTMLLQELGDEVAEVIE